MTQTATLDRGVDFEVDRLDEYLKSWLGGAEPARVRRTRGGMSNPTYFVTRGHWRAVLRKQPNNALMPSAHAVDREYRVLTALQGSVVPTPRPFRYCADRGVIGTPFYLMEWLDGRVFHEFSTPGLRPDERQELFRSMCAALAAIHKLDYHTLGLSDFGKPGVTDDEFDAETALRLGFVQESYHPAASSNARSQSPRLLRRRRRLRSRPRLRTRKMLRDGHAAAAAELAPVQQRLLGSAGAAEGVRIFVERRAAAFKGLLRSGEVAVAMGIVCGFGGARSFLCSIGGGEYADFVVLDLDSRRLPPDEFEGLRSLGARVSGRGERV
jgi:hypothetical protein